MKGHGRILTEIANDNKLTQKEIAKRIGVSPQAVNSDFSEDELSEKRLVKYRDVLGIDIESFLAGEEPAKYRIARQSQSQVMNPAETTLKDELIAMQKELIAELRKRLQMQEKMLEVF